MKCKEKKTKMEVCKDSIRTGRSTFPYRDERNLELLSTFNRLYSTSLNSNVLFLVQEVVNSPSSRFWVSEERAFRVISSMMRYPLSEGCNLLHREMYEEIFRRCKDLALRHPQWTLKQCVFTVVNQPAPKFYLSVQSANAIIYRERRCRRERIRNLRHLLSA